MAEKQESKIKKCHCDSKFQDEKYGDKNRVFNQTVKGYRCTVCGREEIQR